MDSSFCSALTAAKVDCLAVLDELLLKCAGETRSISYLLIEN